MYTLYQLSNHLAVAFGAGSHGLGGCARVEVFAFSLLDDLDDDDNNEGSAAAAASSNIASASVHSGSGHGNGATSSSGSQQQQRGHQVSRFQGLPVGGGGFASKGELKTLAFLDTPRVSFVTALQVNEKNHRGCMQIRESAPARTSTVSGKKLFEAVTSTCTVSCTSYSYSDDLACMLLRCGLASDELSKCSLVISAFPSVLLLPSPFYSVQAVGGSYLMVGDLDLSVQLVHWRAKDKSLNLIGNDSSQATGVAAVGAVVRRMGGVE